MISVKRNRSTSFRAVATLLAAQFFAVAVAQTQEPSAIPNNYAPGTRTFELADNVFVFQQTYSNSIVVIFDGGVLVMDAYGTEQADLLMQELRRRTDLPVEYVVYSHAHVDHVRGASFYEDTAQYVAQERAAEQLARVKNDTFPLPDITFDEMWKVPLSGKDVYLYDFGPNHSTGVTVLYIPEDGIVTVTDLAYRKRFRWMTMPDESPREIARSIREIAERLEFDTAVPGHGPLATYDEVIEHGLFVEDLIQQVTEQLAYVLSTGTPLMLADKEVIERVDTSQYDDWELSAWRDYNIIGVLNAVSEGY